MIIHLRKQGKIVKMTQTITLIVNMEMKKEIMLLIRKKKRIWRES